VSDTALLSPEAEAAIKVQARRLATRALRDAAGQAEPMGLLDASAIVAEAKRKLALLDGVRDA